MVPLILITDLGPYAPPALAVGSAYLVLLVVVCMSRTILDKIIAGEQRRAER